MKLILRNISFTACSFLLILLQTVFAQNTENSAFENKDQVKKYRILKTSQSFIIDGKSFEKDWETARWTDYFVDIEGDSKPQPLYKTRVKMLWDEQFLYIFAQLEEPHIWAYYTNRDQIVYHENDFEVFIDPDCDTQNYFEFEINAANTLFDLLLNKPYRHGGKPNINWDSKNIKTAVYINGTLNNGADTDKYWNVEMAIPFRDLNDGEQNYIPKTGDEWKLNFSRVQWQTRFLNGIYEKKRDSVSNKTYPENNWVWNAQNIVNMHLPERWGVVQFCDKPFD